nr:nmra-like family domain-containing protein 1 [Quercus suber]
MSKLLAVFGATGQQGSSVINYVLHDPEISQQYKIRAITRDVNSEKVKQFKGVEVVYGDVTQRASLEAALKGVNTVFAMTVPSFDPNEVELEYNSGKAIADVAVEQGVEYVIFSTLPFVKEISGGKYTKVVHFDSKARVERYIRGLPIKSAFFSPAAFMENFSSMPFFMPKKDASGDTWSISLPNSPKALLPVIDITRDTGKFIGAILAEPDRYNGETFYGAAEVLTMEQTVAIMSKVSGKKIVYRQLSIEEFTDNLPFAKDIFSEAFSYMDDFAYWGSDPEKLVAWSVEHVRGRISNLDLDLDCFLYERQYIIGLRVSEYSIGCLRVISFPRAIALHRYVQGEFLGMHPDHHESIAWRRLAQCHEDNSTSTGCIEQGTMNRHRLALSLSLNVGTALGRYCLARDPNKAGKQDWVAAYMMKRSRERRPDSMKISWVSIVSMLVVLVELLSCDYFDACVSSTTTFLLHCESLKSAVILRSSCIWIHHECHVHDLNSPASTVRQQSSLVIIQCGSEHLRQHGFIYASVSVAARPLRLPQAIMSLRTLAFRPAGLRGLFRPTYQCRNVTDDKSGSLPVAPPGQSGPNMKQAEHVSEEAAKMAKITGSQGPDLEQGTPVQDILKEEKDQRKQAPEVMKASINKDSKPPTGSRSFSTLARRQQEHHFDSLSSSLDPSMLPSAAQMASYSLGDSGLPTSPSGYKFPLPPSPLPANSNIKTRQEPIVLQFTNSLMRHGKKATAQRNASVILTYLRTAPAPTYNPARPLLPGAPAASHLPLHPTLYLQLAIDSLAPLLRIKAIRGAAGGGNSLQVPAPLNLRQRRRTAIQWILDAASKRKSAGSGNDMFALKVAAEIVSVVEGKSALWDKRAALHKMGTTARANLAPKGRRR